MASIDGIHIGFYVENFVTKLIIIFRYGSYFLFHYVFLTLSETNWFCKVREGRSNGNTVDAETFDGIAEVMLIVQVVF